MEELYRYILSELIPFVMEKLTMARPKGGRMRFLFKIMSLIRWGRAASKGTLHKRYLRVKAMRAINRHIG